MQPGPNVTPHELIGGDKSVRLLVDMFYDLMDETPEYYVIRKLHAQDLAGARDKLYMFLSGWLGGPPLYTEKYGHPMLRARHLPFAIGTAERDAWMACMTQAMQDVVHDEQLRTWLLGQLYASIRLLLLALDCSHAPGLYRHSQNAQL